MGDYEGRGDLGHREVELFAGLGLREQEGLGFRLFGESFLVLEVCFVVFDGLELFFLDLRFMQFYKLFEIFLVVISDLLNQ